MNIDKNPSSILDALEMRAETAPEKSAFILLDQDGRIARSVSFRELKDNAQAVSLRLSEIGLSGARAALMYPPGIEFIIGFLGCLYAGVVAVPVFPPRRNRSNAKAIGIVRDCGAAAVLTDGSTYPQLQIAKAVERWPDNLILAETDNMAIGRKAIPLSQPRNPDAIAMLQYTSGSTSDPKGVALTHANLMSDLNMLKQAASIREEDVCASWLPHYHDMGLIGHILQSIYSGCTCILLSPSAFINRPASWFEAISRFGVTVSGGPSFGYRHCLEKISAEDCAGLSLATWKVAYNAAEPVSPDVMEAFAARFSRLGFAMEAFYPCYGLAEATVFATGGSRGRKPVFLKVDQAMLQATGKVASTSSQEGKIYVGCGSPVAGAILKIVDPAGGGILDPFRVGEVLLSGPNVMNGYWNHRDESESLMRELPGLPGRPFLRTGDLGFVDGEGELFLTGRIKDLIILNGVNYYPQDIEGVAEESSPDLRPGGAVAFSIQKEGREALALAVELARSAVRPMGEDKTLVSRLADSICKSIGNHSEIPVGAIAFLKPGGALRTSSGKIARQACRAAFLSESLGAIATWSPELVKESHGDESSPTTIERTLAFARGLSPEDFKVFNALIGILDSQYGLHLSNLDVTKSIFFYGIDSIKIVDIHGQLEKRLGCEISSFAFFHSNTFAGLISDIAQDIKRGAAWNLEMSLFLQDVAESSKPPIANINSGASTSRLDAYIPRKVLITGTTGFVGGYLLREFLFSTSAEVHCLVRAWDVESGLQRILGNLKTYGIEFTSEQKSRIHVIIGDISKPKLGLDNPGYRRLAEEIDGIYHCAAIDNFYLPYEMLRGANVLGINSIFELASTERVKPVFYTASCAATLFESDLADFEPGGLVTGYAQTKFVGECVFRSKIEGGHPAIYYRLGYLYSNESNAVHREDAFETLIDSIGKIGCVPDMDADFDLTPVEYVVKCILSSSLEVISNPKPRYTFYNPTPLRWSNVISYFLGAHPNVKLIPLEEFVDLFRAHVSGSSIKGVKLLKSVVSGKLGAQFNRMFRNVETDTVPMYSEMCQPCDMDFTGYYINLVLGDGKLETQGKSKVAA